MTIPNQPGWGTSWGDNWGNPIEVTPDTQPLDYYLGLFTSQYQVTANG